MIRPPNLHSRPPVRKAIDLDALAREIARRVLAEPRIQEAIAKSTRPPASTIAARPHPSVAKVSRDFAKLSRAVDEFVARRIEANQRAYTASVDRIVEKVAEARAIAKTAPRALGAAGVEPFKELRQLRRDLAAKTEQFAKFAEALTQNAPRGRGRTK